MSQLCPTCFCAPRSPKLRRRGDIILEQCVDPCHDEEVLTGSAGVLAQTFLRGAIKRWRGSTAVYSLRLHGVRIPPTVGGY